MNAKIYEQLLGRNPSNPEVVGDRRHQLIAEMVEESIEEEPTLNEQGEVVDFQMRIAGLVLDLDAVDAE